MIRKTFAAIVLVVCASGMFAQQLLTLPVDGKIRLGVLPNGLTYYIRHNELPKQRAEFHLAQNVGAILEEDDQNGLAHFLEHMAFNGSEHFPAKGIINYFESVGVSFGGNINAYTSLDETVYRLSDVPTVRHGIIDSALLVMRDWSCGLLLEGDEIDSERGVIREEWRTSSTANRRLWRESNRLKYPGSQYAKRDVIGDTAIINNFSYDALRRYYKQWYGPDLQAVVIVGDIDVDSVEQQLIRLFSDVPERASRGVRPVYTVADNSEPIVAIVTDAEAQQTRIGMEFKHQPLPDDLKLSLHGYKKSVIDNLISTLFSYRFNEITMQADASFIAAYAGYSSLFKANDAFQAIVIPKDGKEKQAFSDLLTQLEKADRYGFTNAELERAKADILNSVEKAYNERDNRENIRFAREYIRHFLDKETIPGIEWEYEMHKTLLPLISTDALNTALKSYITAENVIIWFSAPDKKKDVLPTEEEAITLFNAVKSEVIDAPQEESDNRPLVGQVPKCGKIKSAAVNTSLGTTEWTLSNGLRVVFKPTTFKTDEILLNAYSEGGLSKVENVDLPSGWIATSVVEMNGIGEFSYVELQKLLTGKTVSVSPFIRQLSEGFNGRSSVKDFETLLQLTYLYFTAPRRDDNAFEALKGILHTQVVNREANPKASFSDSVTVTWGSHHPRTVAQLFNMDLLEKIDQERALSIYRERFSTAGDFTFIFTGNVNPNDPATKKAILTWLGGLKPSKKRETYTDRLVRTPLGQTVNRFSRPMQIRTASNRIHYSAAMAYNLKNDLNMTAIGKILDIRYIESVREREGGSYGVGVNGYTSMRPVEQAVLLIQFDTDPEKQERLLNIIHQEVSELLANGPRADDLQKVKENLLKDYAEEIETNSYWSNTVLHLYYIDGLNYAEDYRRLVEQITPESIIETLKHLLASGNVMEVVMFPEND
ncbi:MAG: insulinase family protein [Prevotellaceae bacterium]|jgi:zinc protease|nr:insulinase family protein [Prevotellaceae bacterium]